MVGRSHVDDEPLSTSAPSSRSHPIMPSSLASAADLRAYRAAERYYRSVASAGRLESLPPDPPSATAHVLQTLPRTIPLTALLLQLAWSFLLVGLVRWLPDKPAILTEVPQIDLPNSVALAAGFSLFILLSFAVAEATARRRTALNALYAAFHSLRHAARKLRLLYPPGTWHAADAARLNAHLAAYPLALAQTLSATRHRAPLAPLLAAPDVERVIASPHRQPHLPVAVLLRAYFSSAEEDSPYNFPAVAAARTPAGVATRANMVALLDFIETNAAAAEAIATSRLAPPYVAVLRAASFIWALLVPVALVTDAGWWTPLWAFIATMPVFALLRVAIAIASPFQPGPLAVPLVQLCATATADVLADAAAPHVGLSDVLRPADKSVPAWLMGQPIPQVRGYAPVKEPRDWHSAMSRAARNAASAPLLLGMASVLAWTGFIVFLTWGLSRSNPPFRRDGDRWWRVSIPVPDTSITFIAIALFLLLSFWLGDGNTRRAAALDIWMSRVRPNLDAAAHLIVQVLPANVWHKGDRERLLAFVAALPVCMVQHLHGSRDLAALYALLSPDDVQGFEDDPRPYPTHCADVIFAYLDAADSAEASDEARRLVEEPKRAFFATAFAFQARVLEADRALWESVAIQKTPIAPQFTAHLSIFAGIWLALLPVSIVRTDGFITFIYMAPIAFSMFTLIQISKALADPFGSDDEDVPLMQVCDDIRDSIQRIYFAGREGTRSVIHTKEGYKRDIFDPQPVNEFISSITKSPSGQASEEKKRPLFSRILSVFPTFLKRYQQVFNISTGSPLRREDLPTGRNRVYEPTLAGTLLHALGRLPTISFRSYVGATLWSLIAVYASWGTGKLWEGENRGDCGQWCSPIDVQGGVLGNVGFALFMILALRTTNAVMRYDVGARMMFDFQRELRGLTIEFLQVYKDGFFHDGDKERIIAHIVQIPLCLREMLLGSGHGRNCAVEGLLSDGDKQRFVSSTSPYEHLIESIEVYLLMQDSTIREGWDLDPFRPGPGFTLPMLGRLLALRQIASRASVMKSFPLASSLLRIETMFTVIYIFLLPLTMTSETGFFTILWAPLISYGVLVVRDIAAQLVDPFGNDPDDLPVRQLTTDAISSVLETVSSAGWDNGPLVRAPPPETATNALRALGARLQGNAVRAKYALPSVSGDNSNGDEGRISSTFDAIEQRRKKQTPFTHIAYSAPWRAMAIAFVWSVAASASTAALRRGSLNNEWWNSAVIITADVLDGVSFGAFTLLSFFATSAATRYQQAGTLWQRDMRRACHALATNITKFYKDGAIHESDHQRMLGLIASIPLLIKQELREARDLRDVSALMTTTDLAQAARQENMTLHCIDVLRAYLLRISTRPDVLLVKDVAHPPRARIAFVRFPILDIENIYTEMKFLSTFGFSPAFKTLLKVLLTVWFGILPFLLFEFSGWLTLFWTPIIAYGIIGLYAIANELSEPFGSDLNDHDVDAYSREIVEDILDIQQSQKPAFSELEDPQAAPDDWARELQLPESELDPPSSNSTARPWWKRALETARYAAISVPLWQLVALALWGGIVLGLAFSVRGKFDPTCTGRWYCGLFAVNDDIKEYVGFALFFLLGARITESHGRFASAFALWKGTVTRAARLVANHALESFIPGAVHGDGDMARMTGHLAATAVALGASVRGIRGEKLEERLRKVVSARDAAAIASARDPVARCVDVVRAYILQSEQLLATMPERDGIANEEYFVTLLTLDQLHEGATSCQALARVLTPFGLVMHSRILLGVWLFILPIGIVTRTGWLVVLWTVVVGYGVLAMRRWAEELAQPFGCDESNLPVNEFVDEVVEAVRLNMRKFPRGAKTLLEDGEVRAGFEQFRNGSKKGVGTEAKDEGEDVHDVQRAGVDLESVV